MQWGEGMQCCRMPTNESNPPDATHTVCLLRCKVGSSGAERVASTASQSRGLSQPSKRRTKLCTYVAAKKDKA